MRSRGISALFASLALASFTALGAGCSSADAGGTATAAEGALSTPKAFDFVVDSPRERAGDVETINAYWAARFATLAYDANLKDPLGIFAAT